MEFETVPKSVTNLGEAIIQYFIFGVILFQ